MITTMFAQFDMLDMPDRLIDCFDPQTHVNWSKLEWLTVESENQAYGATSGSQSVGQTVLGLFESLRKKWWS